MRKSIKTAAVVSLADEMYHFCLEDQEGMELFEVG
jgi:hypothetical protein